MRRDRDPLDEGRTAAPQGVQAWWRGVAPRPRLGRRLLVLGGLLGLGLWATAHERVFVGEAPPQGTASVSALVEDPTDDEPGPSAIRLVPASATLRAELLARAVDVWSDRPEATVLDLVLAADDLAWLRSRGVPFEVLVPDVDALAQAERVRLSSAEVARPTPEQWFSEYRDYDTVVAYLDALAALRPELVRVETIGHSLQGRPLRALRIGPASRADGPALLVDGGLHAREWIAVMTATCVADRLVRGHVPADGDGTAGTDDHRARITRLVDEVGVVVVPIANPDGYHHSWTRDRYWRKNRRDGHGVDLNRNFPVAWGRDGSSGETGSQVYRGKAPLSEPESQALRDLMLAERFVAHIDFHSYGQLVLHPWSYTRDPSSDHAALTEQAKALVRAVSAEHGQRYRLMRGASLYPASGTLMDWAYGERGAASFVIELRPRGGTGFVLPPDQIGPTCDEGLAAVLTLGDAVRDRAD